MLEHFAPLAFMALVIITAIAGAVFLFWRLAAPDLGRERLKPDPSGRRRRQTD